MRISFDSFFFFISTQNLLLFIVIFKQMRSEYVYIYLVCSRLLSLIYEHFVKLSFVCNASNWTRTPAPSLHMILIRMNKQTNATDYKTEIYDK